MSTPIRSAPGRTLPPDAPAPRETSTRSRALAAVLMVLGFGVVTVAGGHGLAPIGLVLPIVSYLLVTDGARLGLSEPVGAHAPLAIALGWLGVAATVAAVVLRGAPWRRRAAARSAAGLLSLSLIVWGRGSEVAWLPFLTALPFACAALWWLDRFRAV